MQREHRQCTEGSEGLSLIFVPSFGKVELIQKENTRLQLCTNSSEVTSTLFVSSSGRRFKEQCVLTYHLKEYMVTSIEVVCKDMKKAVYVLY